MTRSGARRENAQQSTEISSTSQRGLGSECTSQLPSAFNHLPVAGQFVATLTQKILDKGHLVFVIATTVV